MTERQQAIVPRIRQFLRQFHVATLATVDEQGLPYAVSLYMVIDEQARFYFVSSPASAHCRHLQCQPHVHLTTSIAHEHWREARGLQVWGTCEPVEQAYHNRVQALYRQRFSCVDEAFEKARKMVFYCITPTRLRWIDNRIRFGFKVDLPWPIPDPASDLGVVDDSGQRPV